MENPKKNKGGRPFENGESARTSQLKMRISQSERDEIENIRQRLGFKTTVSLVLTAVRKLAESETASCPK